MLRELPPPLVVHAPATLRRLGAGLQTPHLPTLDLLELFAFVMPARNVAPTPRGMAQALDLTASEIGRADAGLLPHLAGLLLQRAVQLRRTPSGADIPGLAHLLAQAGWSWAPWLGAALAKIATAGDPGAMPPAEALRVWRRLPKWEETAPRPAPGNAEVAPQEARARLARLLGPDAESRPGQADYADAAAEAFRARMHQGDPHLVLAEAGTGTGKTLGYVAPSSLWAERNGGAVWISTYTRHLQRQIETELKRLHPDQAERRRRVVLRKGRENYLCLLNLEEAVNGATQDGSGTSRGGAAPASLIPLALLARWAAATSDGDVLGGDLPGWFAELFGQAYVMGVADRRGECIHGACPHYQRCYIEHGIRRARQADLVVANHALVLTQAAWHAQGAQVGSGGGTDEDQVPTRYVFDEGHHLPDAADSAFSAVLSGIEAAELRRWLLGAEGGRSRARGLRRRLDDLVAGQPALETPMEAALLAARALPAPGWSLRLGEAQPGLPVDAAAPPTEAVLAADAGPANPGEAMLRLLRRQVLARMASSRQGSQIECDLHPVPGDLAVAAATLERALGRIVEPLLTLVKRLGARLEEEADTLDASTRGRIEAISRTIRRRAIGRLEAWIAMLGALPETPEPILRPDHVMFLRLDRRDSGQGARAGSTPIDRDVGLHRHWLDPSVPFAAVLGAPAHGMLITSATLRDDTGRDGSGADAEISWAAAEARVGASHLPSPALRASLASPFDYASQTRTFVINDVAQDDPEQLAGAYRSLFLTAGGGGLGLFTAISRLRQVHRRIAAPLEAAGIQLFAQHVDAMDNATLVDVFRTETDSCLLGTDAMRDGVDVPGHALRLVVFERVPWPRPDILHRERRLHLSGGAPSLYDDRIARLRLRQAFGRLIRSATDVGVFVLLDRRTPSRLLSAFPAGVVAERIGLAEAVARTGAFLAPDGSTPGLLRR